MENFALEQVGNPGRSSKILLPVIDKEKIGNDQVDMHQRKETNWYVIIGGPGSGKTTSINILKARGYKTTIEHARHYLDTQLIKGKTVEAVRSNQQLFQLGVLKMQINQEAALDPNDLIFLDRAIPDALAYYHFLHLDVDQRLTDAIHSASYKKVFILDCLSLVQDYARREDEAAQKKIHALLVEMYCSLQFPVIHVPVLSEEARVDFILNSL